MQRAADIDIAAYQALIPRITAGMTRHDIADMSRDIYKALGVDAVINAQIDYASALPHGSVKVMPIKEGSTVLMDNRGTNVDGYCSDISRTIFYGEPSQKQKDVWNHMKSAQTAAFEAAKVGVACEEVDAAARESLVANGYGPGYKLPGCPHRTGHGIGLDGHEGTLHLTKGTKRKLEVGMCFSNEPMIVIPGEFGVRLEDCMYMTEQGAKFFSKQQPSYDKPWA
jgi:Xaa-Pro dipeptidase